MIFNAYNIKLRKNKKYKVPISGAGRDNFQKNEKKICIVLTVMLYYRKRNNYAV